MRNTRKDIKTDIMLVLLPTAIIQAGFWTVCNYRAGGFDAHAQEAVGIRQLLKTPLAVQETKYRYDLGDVAKQPRDEEMYVIQTPEKVSGAPNQNVTAGHKKLFEYSVMIPAAQKAKVLAAVQPTKEASKDCDDCEQKHIVYQFKKGSSKLNRMVRDQLAQIIPFIEDRTVTVEGFTCPRGGSRINNILAKDRAKNVADYLKKNGVEVKSVSGKGKSNYISEDERLNRRVEIETI